MNKNLEPATRRLALEFLGTQFPCFTSTNDVQILTPAELQLKSLNAAPA